MFALITVAFALGALVGSFLNVVIYRLPRSESLVKPRSRCPHCQHTIAAYDNIPIISWLLLRGRCRSCGGCIAKRYLIVELATALLFAALIATTGPKQGLWLGLPFLALMVAVAAIDIEHRIVPNKLLAAASVWGLGASLLIQRGALPEQLLAAVCAGGLLLIAALAYPAGMGIGDVKLAAVMGLYLGRAVAPALLAAFAVGAAVGIAIIVREGRSARKKALPFAPFLALGGIVAEFVGNEIVNWYSDSFL